MDKYAPIGKPKVTQNPLTENILEEGRYKHKHGFDDKLGKDPFGLNQFAREVALGLEEEIDEGRKNKKLREIKMSLDDHILISKVFRDKNKMKQIHSLLVQMFPKQKELLDYNYKSDGFNDFRPFIFYIDKYTFEGPNLVPHTKLKLDPDTYKKRDKKYKEYIEGKIDRYFNTSDSDPRKVDLSKVPPITIDAKGIVAGGNHRAFLAIKQQKPLRAYQVVNATNSHPNVEKILNIIGRKKQNLNEYGNSGPSTPKVYIVKDDGTYKEAPIGLLSKISNLTYDMGGGETNYYPEKNIVIVDNIPIEEFIKRSNYSKIKDEKIYVEYNLNQPYSFPKANKIIAAQIVYHLGNREAFAQTIANSLKDGGTFEFFSDLMNKKDKVFLQHLSDEYGFGLPTKLNQYKQEPLPLKKGKFIEPVISYIYKITDKDDKTATLSTTKKGNSWEWKKIDGDIDFKTEKWSVPPESPDPDFRAKKYTLRSFDTYLSVLGNSNTIVDFEKLNEANKPYKHKHGFDDKLGKDPFGLNQFAREVAEGVLNEGRYDRLTNQLSRAAFKVFKDAYDRGDEKGEFKFIVDHPDEEHDIPSKDFFFDFEGYVEFTDDLYFVDGGADVGLDNVGDEIQPILNVSFKIPKNPDWQKVSFDIKDVVRHELEHLTQGGGNLKPGKYVEDDQLVRDLVNAKMLPKSQYFKLGGEVDAMLQGMYFKAKKSRQPFGEILNNYLDIFINNGEITSEEKEDILKVWRSRGKALSLPLFEQTEEQMNYTIYSDMDGVLTDFDFQFMKSSEGIIPSEYKRNFGTNGFWDLIEKGGVGYWAGMPWMSDGRKYWDYIKKYTPLLLSSPSASEPSRSGKRVWVKNNLPGTKLILARSTDKQKYADENSILIDDRPSNIDQWRSQGGIGILHVSAEDTIQQLKKLGL